MKRFSSFSQGLLPKNVNIPGISRDNKPVSPQDQESPARPPTDDGSSVDESIREEISNKRLHNIPDEYKQFASDHGLDHLFTEKHKHNAGKGRFFNSAHQRYETIGLQAWASAIQKADLEDDERLKEANFTEDKDSYSTSVPYRIIDVRTEKLLERPNPNDIVQKYAIFSHMWIADRAEITFQEYQHMTDPNATDNGAVSKLQNTMAAGAKKFGFTTLLSWTKLMEYVKSSVSEKNMSPEQKRQFISNKEAGLKKLKGAIEMTKALGIDYLWIDTCCINKENDREYETAINSMGTWYFNAQVCLVYLSDFQGTEHNIEEYVLQCDRQRAARKAWDAHEKKKKEGGTEEDAEAAYTTEYEVTCPEAAKLKNSGASAQQNEAIAKPEPLGRTWVERAWTLQEILMSQNAYIFDKNWHFQGDALCDDQEIGRACRVDPELICRTGSQHVLGSDIFAAASERVASFSEDKVYSLMGALGVSTWIKYGESFDSAYLRILKLLVAERDDISVFNWSGSFHGCTEAGSSMFPSSLKAFQKTVGKPKEFIKSGAMIRSARTRTPFHIEVTGRGVASIFDVCVIDRVELEEVGLDDNETITWLRQINKARERAGDRSTGYIKTKTILWYRAKGGQIPCEKDQAGKCEVGHSRTVADNIRDRISRRHGLHHEHVVTRAQRYCLVQVLKDRKKTKADVKWAWVRFSGVEAEDAQAPWFLTQVTTTPTGVAFQAEEDREGQSSAGNGATGAPEFKIRAGERLATEMLEWREGTEPEVQFTAWFCIG